MNENKKTLYLDSSTALDLGIVNLSQQDVVLNDCVLETNEMVDYSDEVYLSLVLNKGHAYLEQLNKKNKTNIRVDNTYLADVSHLTNGLTDYEQLVNFKIKNFFIEKGIKASESINLFFAEDKVVQSLTDDELKNNISKYDTYLRDVDFDLNKAKKAYGDLVNETKYYELTNEEFDDLKSTLEAKASIVQILVYLKTIHIKEQYNRYQKANGEQPFEPFHLFNLKKTEFLNPNFDSYEYLTRRDYITNQYDDADMIPVPYEENNQERSKIVSELKTYDDTTMTDLEISNLEQEFYLNHPINYEEKEDELDHFEETIEDVENMEESVVLQHNTDLSSELQNEVDQFGKMIDEKYRRNHEGKMMLEVEDEVARTMGENAIMDSNTTYDLETYIDPNTLDVEHDKEHTDTEWVVKNDLKDSQLEDYSSTSMSHSSTMSDDVEMMVDENEQQQEESMEEGQPTILEDENQGGFMRPIDDFDIYSDEVPSSSSVEETQMMDDVPMIDETPTLDAELPMMDEQNEITKDTTDTIDYPPIIDDEPTMESIHISELDEHKMDTDENSSSMWFEKSNDELSENKSIEDFFNKWKNNEHNLSEETANLNKENIKLSKKLGKKHK
ncbi:hypothetical protein [Ureaplasma canigenitalium]|uniref:hypothetical protein n=1 Tax=Ureaplasma canigenitalium TaxID=42092 RepID=UPI0012EB2779|nr:hypothetical protein [Ureaplasma canigenitalium]